MNRKIKKEHGELQSNRKRKGITHLTTLLSDALLVVRGQEEATVHGCRKILLYSPDEICLQMRHRILCVQGADLCCVSFSGGTVSLEGRIDSVRYIHAEKGEAN